MTRLERLSRTLLVLAPLAGWALLLALGGTVAYSAWRGAPIGGKWFAWLSATLVLVWLARHMAVRFHGRRGRSVGRDEQAELAFALARGRGITHSRDVLHRRGRGPYSGRSHSGERPRFD